MDKKTILLVEDNPDDEALALRALRKCNAAGEVVVARDGLEAVNYLFGAGAYAGRDMSVMPELILLDLKLPKLNGLEVLRRLRSDHRTRLLIVVVLSSSSEEKDIASSYELGANSYLRKPEEFVPFAETMEKMGYYWLVLNTAPPAVEC